MGAVNFGVRHQRRFLRAALGQHQSAWRVRNIGGRPRQCQAHGQRTPHRPQIAAERQLTGKLVALELLCIDLSAGRQDAQRDGQVKAARVFGQVGRRQIDGDALVGREFKSAVLDR